MKYLYIASGLLALFAISYSLVYAMLKLGVKDITERGPLGFAMGFTGYIGFVVFSIVLADALIRKYG